MARSGGRPALRSFGAEEVGQERGAGERHRQQGIGRRHRPARPDAEPRERRETQHREGEPERE
ncbi:hypothetical protein MKK54_11725, partial [Methylobacterium sp. J-068]